ncbi:MAG: universal stress protein [Verrucomicrobiales bacterium]|nr:universal stress protein [Verrucomicrobiales bacterium]
MQTTQATPCEPADQSAATESWAPLQLRTILVPVDFSDRSLQTLDLAVAVARQFGSGAILLHVTGIAMPPTRYESAATRRLRAEVWQEGQRRLAALADEQVRPFVPTRCHAAHGSPGAVIVSFATNAQADLIIMASERRTGLRRLLIGSVAEHVVRHAGCPVLIVRQRPR